jgi:hypothetical protein
MTQRLTRSLSALALLAALFVFPARAGADEYEVSVVGTPINVTDYKIYSDAFPAGHAGPGDFFFTRIGNSVHVWGKLDIQATTIGALVSIQLSLPHATHISNYAYAVGHGTNPGSKPSGAIFGSQIGVEGNDTSVVFKFIPATTDMRAYAIVFDYEVEP